MNVGDPGWDDEIDPLLRHSLGTELTPEVRERMDRCVREFRERLEEHPVVRRRPAVHFPAPWLAWRGAALSLCAAAIIALIFVVPSEASLTRSLAAVREAHDFHSLGRLAMGVQTPVRWEVWWAAPDQLRIDYATEDGQFALSQWRSANRVFTRLRDAIGRTYEIADMPEAYSEQLQKNAETLRFRSLSSAFLSGRWRETGSMEVKGRPGVVYQRRIMPNTLPLLLVVDPVTDLPVWWHFRKELPRQHPYSGRDDESFIEGEFTMEWNGGVDLQQFVPESVDLQDIGWARLSAMQSQNFRSFSRMVGIFLESAQNEAVLAR